MIDNANFEDKALELDERITKKIGNWEQLIDDSSPKGLPLFKKFPRTFDVCSYVVLE